LRAQVFLDAHRVVSAALHRGIVADHQALAAADAAYSRDDAGAGRLIRIHAVGRQRRQLQERRAGIEQHFDAIAGQQFAARHVFGARGFAAPQRGFRLPGAQLTHQRAQGGRVGREFRTFPIDFGFQQRHDCRTIVQPDIPWQATWPRT
jgi:hypothetical protein